LIVYLLRHGEAEFHAAKDQDRALTDSGRKQLHTLCDNRAKNLKDIEHVYHSPYKRAVQTAHIVCQHFPVASSVSPSLTPDSAISSALKFIYETSEHKQVALFVTHQPLIGSLVSALVGADEDRYGMGTGSFAAFQCDPPVRDCCELRWLDHV